MSSDTRAQTPSTTKTLAPGPKESREWLWSLIAGVVILGLVATIPVFGDASALHTWTLILMFVVLAQSWDFIGGFTGYSAFGNVAFFGIGAYSVGLWLTPERPFWVGLVIGAVAAGIFAVVIGLPVLRLKGHYFAIATLGTAEALRQFVGVRNI